MGKNSSRAVKIIPLKCGILKIAATLKTLVLSSNRLSKLPDSVGDLIKLESLFLDNNQLVELPDSITTLQKLGILELSRNQLTKLPERIGTLTSLTSLDLNHNQLNTLPESFGDLGLLESLSLERNKLTRLPASFWRLRNLAILHIEAPIYERETLTDDPFGGTISFTNPWNTEYENLISEMVDSDGYILNVPTFLQTLRKRVMIHIFISHIVKEFQKYSVEALANFLGMQKEIYPQVFYSEKYMVGNMQNSMKRHIQESQIILFIASKAALDSGPCQFELETAINLGKEIIPLRGDDLTWEEIADKGLAYVKGLDIDLDNFDQFCTDLYAYIKKYKREINLFEKKKAQVDKKILKLKEEFKELIDSPGFRDQPKKIDELSNYLKKFRA